MATTQPIHALRALPLPARGAEGTVTVSESTASGAHQQSQATLVSSSRVGATTINVLFQVPPAAAQQNNFAQTGQIIKPSKFSPDLAKSLMDVRSEDVKAEAAKSAPAVKYQKAARTGEVHESLFSFSV
ncbi:MAG: hypothetical protein EB121_08575 [Alphaproteobacteria bacterium]|nr:hypothetical protein [Alphaproteobacteria bacterium]NDG05380.1 hypothetical protein [Alphaproteobacteria bacterium]